MLAKLPSDGKGCTETNIKNLSSESRGAALPLAAGDSSYMLAETNGLSGQESADLVPNRCRAQTRGMGEFSPSTELQEHRYHQSSSNSQRDVLLTCKEEKSGPPDLLAGRNAPG